MKLIIIILLSMSLLVSSVLKAEAPPVNFDKETFIYKILRNFAFDFDKYLKEAGLRIHSCEVATENKNYVFPSVGNCLLIAVHNSLKKQSFSRIKVWTLNEKGEYLNPLIINWKVSQKNWIKYLSEFVGLSFENFFKKFRHKGNLKEPCQNIDESFLKKDIGNFIGDLEISAEAPWKLSDYFSKIPEVKEIIGNARDLELNVKSPEYLRGQKIYEFRFVAKEGQKINENSNMLVVQARSNINFLLQRDFCLNADVEYSLEAKGLP